MEVELLPAFSRGLWYNVQDACYRVFVGARGTGKTSNIGGMEPLLKMMCDPMRNVVFLRENDVDNARSTYENLRKHISLLGVGNLFQTRQNPRSVIYIPTGQKVFFAGCNNPTGLNSLDFSSGLKTDLYIEEASEIQSEEEFRMLDKAWRAQWTDKNGREWHSQITFLLNPWDVDSWIAKKFCLPFLKEDEAYMETHDFQDVYIPDFRDPMLAGKGLYVHRSSFRANPYLPDTWKEGAEIARQKAPMVYRTEYLGLWGNTQGAAYPEWNRTMVRPIGELLYGERRPYWFAIGIDTGLSDGQGKFRGEGREGSATTCQLVAMDYECTRISVLDEWYWTNEGKPASAIKTGPAVYSEIAEWIARKFEEYAKVPYLMKGLVSVYVDCADIGGRDGIEAYCMKRGLAQCRVMQSGKKGKIAPRVSFTRTMMATGNFVVSDRCPHLIQELNMSRVGKNGQPRDGVGDHAINAMEYAWYPFRNKIRRWAMFDK